MRVERGDAVALARELVRVDSRNPALCPGAPGESAIAAALLEILRAWGLDARAEEAAPGRPNVVAQVGGSAGPSLLFNGHLDTVGVEGMVHEPWAAEGRDGRIYGRGASDMKAGVAAMCAAAARLDGEIRGRVMIAAVVDEEFESAGTRALVEHMESRERPSAAIVTEPTGLAIMPAHRGFVWLEVTTTGRAAHGSRWDLGIDAIRHAGLLLAELDRLDADDLPKRTHALLGRPSLHASLIQGGSGMSTYPDRCVVHLERRTIPGETPAQVAVEIESACARVRARAPGFEAGVRVTLSRPPSDVAVDAPVVVALRKALVGAGEEARVAGMSAWTDAALLNEAGIPAICFGPGDMGLAHAAEEWASAAEIERATEVLVRLGRQWCGARSP
jgi:acetylornithine deacetylase